MPQRITHILFRFSALLLLYCLGLVLYFVFPMALLLLVIGVAVRLVKRRRERLTTLGSARWAEVSDLRRANAIDAATGPIVGRLWKNNGLLTRCLPHRLRPCGPAVRLPKAIHTAVFAPTGVGKGVSFVIPTLLSDPSSCVVIDFKGENALLTARHRERVFGQRTVLLDPYQRVTTQPDTFNPLDFILSEDSLALDDCNDLANSLVVRSGEEREPHWSDSAEAYISGISATVVAYGEEDTRSLGTVRDILSHPYKLDLALKLMLDSDRWNGALSSMGGQLLHFTDKEKSSVLSSALRHLRFLGTPAIAQSTARSSFDPSELRNGKMSIYLILPPDRASAQAGLLRMWVGSLLRACVKGGVQ